MENKCTGNFSFLSIKNAFKAVQKTHIAFVYILVVLFEIFILLENMYENQFSSISKLFIYINDNATK